MPLKPTRSVISRENSEVMSVKAPQQRNATQRNAARARFESVLNGARGYGDLQTAEDRVAIDNMRAHRDNNRDTHSKGLPRRLGSLLQGSRAPNVSCVRTVTCWRVTQLMVTSDTETPVCKN